MAFPSKPKGPPPPIQIAEEMRLAALVAPVGDPAHVEAWELSELDPDPTAARKARHLRQMLADAHPKDATGAFLPGLDLKPIAQAQVLIWRARWASAESKAKAKDAAATPDPLEARKHEASARKLEAEAKKAELELAAAEKEAAAAASGAGCGWYLGRALVFFFGLVLLTAIAFRLPGCIGVPSAEDGKGNPAPKSAPVGTDGKTGGDTGGDTGYTPAPRPKSRFEK